MSDTRITAEMLRERGACESQVRQFAEMFPRGTKVTAAACKEAAALDLDWFARHFLTGAALADYDAERALLLADYKAKHAPLLADYNAKRALLWADYDAERALLLADCDAKYAPLLADFDAKYAALLAAAWETKLDEVAK